MKSRASSLNPNAAPYIPQSKRVVDSKSGILGGPSIITESSIHSALGFDGRKAWRGSNAHETDNFPISGNFSLPVHHTPGLSSQHPAMTDKLISDEVYDMELEYLQMAYPGLSHQSLTDVYLANGGDMEASIDMLNDLESNPYESPENLPETLDIGDVSETISSTDRGTLKLKNIAGGGADSSTSSTHRPPSLY